MEVSFFLIIICSFGLFSSSGSTIFLIAKGIVLVTVEGIVVVIVDGI